MATVISIIVPCYNQAQYLDESLESVLAQTFQDWECIIVNDGSTDNTKEISENWLKKDHRFKYIFQENAGLSATRNKGIENAIGEFILPLDADDKISSEYCKLAMIEFEKDENLKVVYCQAEKFGYLNEKWNLPHFSLTNLAVSNQIFCSAFFKKVDFLKTIGYDERLIYGWEDWELWIAILKNGGGVKKINKTCFFYRTKEKSMVKSMTQDNYDFSNNYVIAKHPDFFFKCFNELNLNIKRLKSKKFVLNLFVRTFLGFNLFKKFKNL